MFINNLLKLICLVSIVTLSACIGDTKPVSERTVYTLDDKSSGVIETVNNIVNIEYRAGFVQGKLQGKSILSAREGLSGDSGEEIRVTTSL